MLEENLQVTPKVDLGQNIYEQEKELQPTVEVEVIDDGYFGKPEKYDYANVQLPESYCYDDDLLNEFNELAGKYNLSQKGADELMSMAVKLTQLMGTNYSNTLAEQQRQQVENYKHNLLNDRELGGANLDKTMRAANIAYTQFADEDVQDVLAQFGLNCHPKIVKMFYNIGKKMQNDVIDGINANASHQENREDILFPTMQ